MKNESVVVYGSSDDLIEIDGAIREEFGPSGDDGEPDYLAFSDGTVLSIAYSKDGFWRVNRVASGSAAYAKKEGDDVDSNYSDRVALTGDIRWCLFGTHFEKVKP